MRRLSIPAALLVLLLAHPGLAAAPSAKLPQDRFVGMWSNTVPPPGEHHRVEITKADAGFQIRIAGLQAPHPAEPQWGKRMTLHLLGPHPRTQKPHSSNRARSYGWANWDYEDSNKYVVLHLENDQLILEVYTLFKGNSKRSHYRTREAFVRVPTGFEIQEGETPANLFWRAMAGKPPQGANVDIPANVRPQAPSLAPPPSKQDQPATPSPLTDQVDAPIYPPSLPKIPAPPPQRPLVPRVNPFATGGGPDWPRRTPPGEDPTKSLTRPTAEARLKELQEQRRDALQDHLAGFQAVMRAGVDSRSHWDRALEWLEVQKDLRDAKLPLCEN